MKLISSTQAKGCWIASTKSVTELWVSKRKNISIMKNVQCTLYIKPLVYNWI